jgi:transcriptional regulator with XRE-family HTH domain
MRNPQLSTHWTAEDTASFQHFVAFDFLDQIEQKLDEQNMSRTDLAKKLGVDKSRVSQIFSNPGNLTLRNMVEWARAVDLKLGILAYDDGEVAGERGPVSSWIFLHCWDRMRKPRDMADIGAITGCPDSVEV